MHYTYTYIIAKRDLVLQIKYRINFLDTHTRDITPEMQAKEEGKHKTKRSQNEVTQLFSRFIYLPAITNNILKKKVEVSVRDRSIMTQV